MLATGAFLASLLGGLGLGRYTIGGFKMRAPVDIISQMASGRERAVEAEAQDAVMMPQPPARPVCTGCDARLDREAGWDGDEADWAREDAESWEADGGYAEEQAPDAPLTEPPQDVIPAASAATTEVAAQRLDSGA